MRRIAISLMALLFAAACEPTAQGAVRVKDITDFAGARSNQLIGFGLVVGLDGTGSRSLFTQRVAVDMLQRFNVNAVIASQNRVDNVLRSGNISAVMVTAELGPFDRIDSRIDVTVSVLDDSTSLQGGTLLMTPLKGADNVDYAVAQGPLSVGGFLFSVPSGSQQPIASAQKNHPNVGRIPSGATVEKEVRGEINCNGQLRLLLRDPDYTTITAIAKAINLRYPDAAVTLDAATLQIFIPKEYLNDVVPFAAAIGQMEVNPDYPARVVINERTGTIVSGGQVKLSAVAVAHGSLSITTYEDFFASQPPSFSAGSTVVVPGAGVDVKEQKGALKVVDRSVTVAEVARALNALQATPRDLIAIFQAIKEAGALHAELVIQ
jgi:flagellar P-ring protein precursor FlgI